MFCCLLRAVEGVSGQAVVAAVFFLCLPGCAASFHVGTCDTAFSGRSPHVPSELPLHPTLDFHGVVGRVPELYVCEGDAIVFLSACGLGFECSDLFLLFSPLFSIDGDALASGHESLRLSSPRQRT